MLAALDAAAMTVRRRTCVRHGTLDAPRRVNYNRRLPNDETPTPLTRRNAFYAQSGGVTAVINASACGVIQTARQHKRSIGRVYAGRNGIIGALTEDLIDTGRESSRAIAALMHTPAGAFGSCRYKLAGIDRDRAQYERLLDVFALTISATFSTTAATTRPTPASRYRRWRRNSTIR
jgi:hypothetical protein